MWLLPILPEVFNATNDHLKKKCLFSLSFIYARWQFLFYTDLFSAIVGKIGSSAGFSVVYVYTAELFPTQVHNLSFFLYKKLFYSYIVKFMTKPLFNKLKYVILSCAIPLWACAPRPQESAPWLLQLSQVKTTFVCRSSMSRFPGFFKSWAFVFYFFLHYTCFRTRFRVRTSSLPHYGRNLNR
jgi:hypothetical protein